jgi:hypothetical protein
VAITEILILSPICRAELGRATWKYLHTVMARFPEKPTPDEQEALRSFIHLFARLYPWYGDNFSFAAPPAPPRINATRNNVHN